MKRLISVLLQASLAGVLVIATACKGTQTAGNNNQTNGNSGPQTSDNSNASQGIPRTLKSATEPEPTGTGSIEVKTKPPGARVILISLDEVGAQPQQKGLTPTTITDIPVGKYTVNIEKPGYRYYQKNIKVQKNKTTQVGASLQKD
jgi:hypothetical protein